ncbi:MAG: zinc ribbon domain-containing protein [Spirochaetes bacterium]|nr:zinc ribbon domain-containing protein [Spirochaetota bacterium]
MPLYEFKCRECGKSFSELRRVGDDEGVPCSHCGSVNTKKMVSSFASISSRPASSCSTGGG